jgi:hypothetical protein
LAERLVDNKRLSADCVEVTNLGDHHAFASPSTSLSAVHEQTRSRAS